MHQSFESVSYAETADAQVVSIPLAGGELSVVLALPKKSLASFVSSLTAATWAADTQFTPTFVQLSLPKLTFTSKSFSLASSLQALGMKRAFSPDRTPTSPDSAPRTGRNSTSRTSSRRRWSRSQRTASKPRRRPR